MDTAVRRLTERECERLQGFPSIKKYNFSEMTKDEYIAWNLSVGNIITDAEKGKVYKTRGPGGISYKNPKEVKGTDLNGYLVMTIKNGDFIKQCRLHRIIWISVHGVIPEGYVIDHINNNKHDNRIKNLQLLSPGENSTKAKEDGLYKTGLDNPCTKLDPKLHDEIIYLYTFSELSCRKLAEIYGVSKSRIHQIVTEIGWTEIGIPTKNPKTGETEYWYTDSNGKQKKVSASARYKALGNSIALPYWQYLARRIVAQYEHDVTMGSLFDGISGFPLVFARCGAKPLWSSEIESFPIAVCKQHFGDEDAGIEGDYRNYL